MFKYANLCWSITFTLDISFSQQSLLDPCLLGQWPLLHYAHVLCQGKWCRGCVLLFVEGRLNTTALHEGEDTWGELRALGGPEQILDAGQQVCG